MTDQGFRRAGGVPANVVVCERGVHNERMIVETVLSLLTRLFGLKQLAHRAKHTLSTRLADVAACFNTLHDLAGSLHVAQFIL